MSPLQRTVRSVLLAVSLIALAGPAWAAPPTSAVTDGVRCGVDGSGAEANRVSELTLRYSGAAGTVTVYDHHRARRGRALFSGHLSPGQEVTVRSSTRRRSKLGRSVSVYTGRHKVAVLTTTCADPLGPGTTEQTQPSALDPNGRVDVTVVAGKDKHGRALRAVHSQAPSCSEVSAGALAAAGSAVRGAQARLVVPEGACPVTVNFSVYGLPSGEVRPFEDQEFLGNVTDTYGPGTYHLRLDAPACGYQTDLYVGDVLEELGPNAHAGVLIDADVTNRGVACEPPPSAECVRCGVDGDGEVADRVSELTLRYEGPSGIVTVYDSEHAAWGKALFWGYLETGAEVTVRASTLGRHALNDEVSVYSGWHRVAVLTTTCAEPLGPGTTEQTQPSALDPNGRVDVTVVAGKDKHGRPLCEPADDPCLNDAGPPTIAYSAVDEDGQSFIVATVTDDTGIATAEFEEEGTDNLAFVESDFTPGATSATFRYRIVDLTKQSRLAGRATDACGNTLCPAGDDNEVPSLTTTLVVYDDETGAFQSADAPREPGVFDRFGRLIEVTDDTGLVKYETFARRNTTVFVQPVEDCESTEGCALTPPEDAISVVIATTDVTVPGGGEFGFFAADECNVFVFDPALPSGTAGARTAATQSVASQSYVAACPSGHPDAGLASALAVEEAVEFGMEQNRPNPFSGRSTVEFSVPDAGAVHLAVYDMLGRTVRVLVDGDVERGRHTAALDAGDLPSGTYIYRLVSDHGTAVKQMVVVR